RRRGLAAHAFRRRQSTARLHHLRRDDPGLPRAAGQAQFEDRSGRSLQRLQRRYVRVSGLRPGAARPGDEVQQPVLLPRLTMGLPSSEPNLPGNTSLSSFDVLIIGSGAGGSAAAYVLTNAGLKVLMIEAGDNNFPGLDDPRPDMPIPRYGNDELKQTIRLWDVQDPIVEPRTWRTVDTFKAVPDPDINILS